MSFDPGKIVKGKTHSPRKMVIYGEVKVGKSELAASAKDHFIIHFEDNLSQIDGVKWNDRPIQSYVEFMDVLQWLSTEDHPYKRLIIDTIDWLEPHLLKAAADDVGASDINDDSCKVTNYQKGMKFVAPGKWKELTGIFDYLRMTKGMDIILISHEKKSIAKLVGVDPFERSVMKIDEHSIPIIEEWADIILYYCKERFVTTEKKQKAGRAIDTGIRTAYVNGTNSSYLSGNRYGIDDFEITKENMQNAIEYLLTFTKPENEQQKSEKPKKGEK